MVKSNKSEFYLHFGLYVFWLILTIAFIISIFFFNGYFIIPSIICGVLALVHKSLQNQNAIDDIKSEKNKLVNSEIISHGNYNNNDDLRKYKSLLNKKVEEQFNSIDYLDGWEFEKYIASLLEKIGYYNIKITSGSGDYGADIVAEKDGVKCAFQCKRFNNKVGPKVVGEVLRGMNRYKCQKGIIVTNNYFSVQAIKEAQISQIELWNRKTIIDILSRVSILQIQNENDNLQGTLNSIVLYNKLSNLLKQIIIKKSKTENNEELIKNPEINVNSSAKSELKIENQFKTSNLNDNNVEIQDKKYPRKTKLEAIEYIVENIEYNYCSFSQLLSELLNEGFDESVSISAIEACEIDWNLQALKYVKEIIDDPYYSYKALIKELISEKFTDEQAKYAADNCGINWNEQAVKCINENFNDNDTVTPSEIRDELECAEFEEENIQYAIKKCKINWNDQAVKNAKNYRKEECYLAEEIVEMLMEDDGFTSSQAQYGVKFSEDIV